MTKLIKKYYYKELNELEPKIKDLDFEIQHHLKIIQNEDEIQKKIKLGKVVANDYLINPDSDEADIKQRLFKGHNFGLSTQEGKKQALDENNKHRFLIKEALNAIIGIENPSDIKQNILNYTETIKSKIC